MLPAQISPEEGARARGDAEGGRVLEDRRGRGLGRRQVCPVPTDALGHSRAAHGLHSFKGESMPTMWSVLRASGVLVPARVFNMLVDLAALALVDLALARLTAPLQGPLTH